MDKVEYMDRKFQSQVQLIAGILGIIVASLYPFIDSWRNPELAKFNVLIWTVFSGMMIYSSQKLKYESLMGVDTNSIDNEEMKNRVALGVIFSIIIFDIMMAIGYYF